LSQKVGESKISSSWLITLVKTVRTLLNLKKDDTVEFFLEDGKIVVKRKETKTDG
jgi:bifunctional DNA-binding transcriptional regulator/antitoxin component of YhaV-PrlF toxin-antitoxin module